MGIMANTVSVYQYRVMGEMQPDLESWVGEALRKNAFTGIEATPDEEALGWVALDDHLDSTFENPNYFHRGDYLFFTLRRDRRRVPGAFLKNMLTQECRRWLEHHPNFKRVPSKRKAEIRENLHVSLLPRTLPVPSTVDLVWNTALGLVTIATTNAKTLELVEEEFRQSFAGLLLSPIHPMEKARMVVSEALEPALTRADQAASADVLLQIKKNRWVGWDFLLWLMHQTSTSGSRPFRKVPCHRLRRPAMPKGHQAMAGSMEGQPSHRRLRDAGPFPSPVRGRRERRHRHEPLRGYR